MILKLSVLLDKIVKKRRQNKNVKKIMNQSQNIDQNLINHVVLLLMTHNIKLKKNKKHGKN